MKEIEEEADRLIELYKPMLTQYGVSDNFAKDDAIQCAIIDVSNTIRDNENMLKWAKNKKAPQNILHGIDGNIGWHK